jgi:hypothetical protein
LFYVEFPVAGAFVDGLLYVVVELFLEVGVGEFVFCCAGCVASGSAVPLED